MKKYSLKQRIICFLILIPCIPLFIIPILKNVFYTISYVTELIGDLFYKVDMMLGEQIRKYIK